MISMAILLLSSIPVAALVQIFPGLGSIMEKSFETLLNLLVVFPK